MIKFFKVCHRAKIIHADVFTPEAFFTEMFREISVKHDMGLVFYEGHPISTDYDPIKQNLFL